MAVRASWTGTLGFGLVSIPVGTTPAVRENDVAYKQFHKVGDELNPVGRNNVDKVTGEVVEYGDIIRGYVASNGVVVEVNDAELDALAPESGKHIEIEKFVDLDEVRDDDLFFAKNEYAFPKGKGSEKPYALMVSALAMSGKAGLGTTVRRGKAAKVLVRAVDGVLVVTFLHWDDEVRPASYVGVELPAITEAEHAMASALIDAMTGEWDRTELVDAFRVKAIESLEAKAEGKAPAKPVEAAKPAVTDLMAALQASVEASKAKKEAVAV